MKENIKKGNSLHMSKLKKDIAYYHLPGLFEFYELYKVFLSIFREHREYFYDWCDIGSIYGAPVDCSGVEDGQDSGNQRP